MSSILTKQQAEAYEKLTEYIVQHPEIIQDAISNYIHKNYVNISEVNLGDKKFFDFTISIESRESDFMRNFRKNCESMNDTELYKLYGD